CRHMAAERTTYYNNLRKEGRRDGAEIDDAVSAARRASADQSALSVSASVSADRGAADVNRKPRTPTRPACIKQGYQMKQWPCSPGLRAGLRRSGRVAIVSFEGCARMVRGDLFGLLFALR